MKKIRLLISYLIGLIAIFFLYLLKPFKKIVFVQIKLRSFGFGFDSFNSYLNMDEYKNLQTSKNLHILWFDNPVPCSKYVKSLFEKKFKTYEFNFFFYSVDKTLRQFKLKDFYFDIVPLLQLEKKFFLRKENEKINFGLSYNNYISFSKNEINLANETLSSFGLKKKDKWICIHNRDTAFKIAYCNNNLFEPQVEESVHKYRNFSVESLKKASEFFADKGYYVFRIGSNQENEISFKSKKIIDYSFSKFKNSFLDIFLLANCSLYFGSNSGMCSPAITFKRPLAHINFPPLNINISSVYKTLPSLIKKIVNIHSGNPISIKEMYEKKLMGLSLNNEILNLGYTHVDNTEEEILELAIENIERLEEKSTIGSDEYCEYNKEYLKITNYYNQKYLNESFLKNPIILGKQFLKKNLYLLN